MENFKKIDREYCWTDESVNVYGYRCLTSGCMVDQFEKNPIGFKMHNRDNGVVVRWEDFRVDGDKIYAKPVINLKHPDAERTIAEIESGFLNAASCGKIVVLEASNAPELMLPGQKGPTLVKWYPREISLVDIPGNHGALANLYDSDGADLDLADFVKPKTSDMSKSVLLAATVLAALNLSDSASQDEFNQAVQDLADRAAKADELQESLNTVSTELQDLKAETTRTRVQDLIDKGKTDKKLTVALAEKLAKDYAHNPDGLADLISTMPAQTLISGETPDAADLADLQGKDWDTLYQQGHLERVRTQYPDLYEQLRKTKFPESNS